MSNTVDQYEQLCAECDLKLAPWVHIYCCSRGDEEMVVCSDCWQTYGDEWREEGWKGDEDEEEGDDREACCECDNKIDNVDDARHIYHKKDKEDKTLCVWCWDADKEEMREDGWECDEDSDEE